MVLIMLQNYDIQNKVHNKYYDNKLFLHDNTYY